MSTAVTAPKTSAITVTDAGGRSSVSGVAATVFGATGMIGRYVVERLAGVGSQVIVPFRSDGMNTRHLKVMGDYGQVVPLQCQVSNENDVKRALSRSNVVVNCIGSMYETRNYSYHDAHVKTAYRIAKLAKQAGVQRFVQLSTVNAHINSDSKWIATKAEAENAVRAFFPDATILRLCTVYGEEDRFLNRLAGMATLAPAVPVVNNGTNLIQPVFVLDVANAVLNAVALPEAAGETYELGGPQVLSYSDMLELIFKEMILPSTKQNMPWAVAEVYARTLEFAPQRFRVFSRDQLQQLKYDMIVSPEPGTKTLADLHVVPHDFQPTVARCMVRHRGDREVHREGIPKPLDVY